MKRKYQFVVIGCGPGGEEYITPAAFQKVQSANIVFGTEDLLSYFPGIEGKKVVFDESEEGQRIDTVLDKIDSGKYHGRIAFLTVGDAGLFSISDLLKTRYAGQMCELVPGISPIQVAFARIGLSQVNAMVIYAHTSNIKIDLTEAYQKGKVCILLGGPHIISAVVELYIVLGGEWTLFICENLTLPDENVWEYCGFNTEGLNISKKATALIIKKSLL